MTFQAPVAPAGIAHPLVARLISDHGMPLVEDAAALADWAARPGLHCLFLPGADRPNPETPDVAVILPELAQAFQGAFDCAVAGADAEAAAKLAAEVHKTPNLVFWRDGQVQGCLPRVRDWSDYMTAIPRILAAGAAL
ncbi:hydrogenase accessory protein [Albimonas sp. CAU 1670]|uniref:hydrogenase accessory protein n=1 Tax=Albimonas sp. CAU 1670 TaxID=3032599 RepID=UPI0023DBC0EE|nr:hydrogenase accessory protein [Albimonas sp. CAU 1670]MDF2235641.1 hydrogenase accessory protein [Albimonas sp. CAU 1670]